MKRFWFSTTALVALLALSAPAAQSGGEPDGYDLDGPVLDGGQGQMEGGPRLGAPAAEEARRIATNGPALDGRRVALPDLASSTIGQLRLPGDSSGMPPTDQR